MKYQKGEISELRESEKFHVTGLALLVSSKLLRARSMGQIDLAKIESREIIIGEVKTSGHLGHKQNLRLRLTANYLSQIFSFFIHLILIHASH